MPTYEAEMSTASTGAESNPTEPVTTHADWVPEAKTVEAPAKRTVKKRTAAESK